MVKRLTVVILVVLAAVVAVAPVAAAPSGARRQQAPRAAANADLRAAQTIREAIAAAGYSYAAVAPGAPPLDAQVTASQFAFDADSFVAAYYLKEELRGHGLGPLHVCVFRPQAGRWFTASGLADDVSGSVVRVHAGPRYFLVELHANPSSGIGLVFDADSARLLARLDGMLLRVLADGTILFSASMVHFAPTHQERLVVYDPARQAESEIFPGQEASALARKYRHAIVSAYDRLPEAQRGDYGESAYGPINDADRSIRAIAEREGGGAVAFVVSYEAMRMRDRSPRFETVVRCDRDGGAWSCNERAIDEAARAYRIRLPRDEDGRLDDPTVEALVKAVLTGPRATH